MKILYMHARNLKIESDTDSKNARKMAKRLGQALPKVDEWSRRIESGNALLAFVCVEKGDEKLRLEKVRDDILRARKLLGVPEIVLGSFAHLSENVAEPLLARRVVDDLTENVREAHLSTKQFPFGWDKSLDLHLPCHHYNAAMRTFRPSESAWDAVSDGYSRYMEETGHYAAQTRLLRELMDSGAISGNLLEVCCGTGFALEYLHAGKRLQFIVGLDSSERMLERARRRIAEENGSGMVNLVNARADEIEDLFGPGTFDTLLMINAAAYIDMKLVLEKARLVLRQNANIILIEEEPFVPAFLEKLDEKQKLELCGLKHPSIEEIVGIAKEKGFTLVRSVRTAIDEKHSLIGAVLRNTGTESGPV